MDGKGSNLPHSYVLVIQLSDYNMIAFDLENETFNASIHVMFGNDVECRKHINERYDIQPSEGSDLAVLGLNFAGGVFVMESIKYGFFEYVMWIRKFATGIISHESMHAVTKILSDRGVPHTEDTDEVYAYLTGWLNSEIVNKYRENKSKNKSINKNEQKTKKQQKNG